MTRLCQHVLCQKSIDHKRPEARYCDKRCKHLAKDWRAIRRRGPLPKATKLKQRACVICDKPFIHRAAGNPKMTCSALCNYAREYKIGQRARAEPRQPSPPKERERYRDLPPHVKAYHSARRKEWMADPVRHARKTEGNRRYRQRNAEKVRAANRARRQREISDARSYRLLIMENRADDNINRTGSDRP